jgi:signal transduction histidine kinase
MMDDVLQLARIQAHRVEFAPALDDLQALCCDIIEEFRSCPEYKERIHYENNCLPVQLNFDPRLMRHIIGNLIANGLKYSRNEKPITVKLWLDPVQVVLQVTDDGIGIPDADLNHIFEPFHRASNVGTISGTGLGLSITKEAIEMHGGRIHIATAVSAGTTVTVTLPINPAKGGDDAKDSDH